MTERFERTYEEARPAEDRTDIIWKSDVINQPAQGPGADYNFAWLVQCFQML